MQNYASNHIWMVQFCKILLQISVITNVHLRQTKNETENNSESSLLMWIYKKQRYL